MKKIIFNDHSPAFHKSLYDWIREEKDENLSVVEKSYRLEEYLYFIYRFKKIEEYRDISFHLYGDFLIIEKFRDWALRAKAIRKFSFAVPVETSNDLDDCYLDSSNFRTDIHFHLIGSEKIKVYYNGKSIFLESDLKTKIIERSSSKVCVARIY